MATNRTKERVAIITGAGSGMGLAVARNLSRQGWNLSLADMNTSTGEAAAKEVGGIFTKTDVTSYNDQAALFQKTKDEFGQIDFVYANAGIVDSYNFYAAAEKLPPPPLPLLCQDVCLTGVVYSSYLGMHYMRQNPDKGGVIVMTSSAAGIYKSPALPVYAGAKHAVVGFMRSMAAMIGKDNIRVNCTIPGVVQTNLCDEETWKAFPSERFTKTSDIVNAVQMILDDESMNGQAVEISKDKTYFREELDFCDENQRATMSAAGTI
ncbi:NAD(P)-binding protein [Lophiostoma macrostomum CBS 122681]|uniref:NAD(P)-binding protein n=1 Tax=Lophiostoma macrostomum CBS 122681 TaxID=1314788 RepID=A0A6A6T2E1_9PLEO|nr:NAD(P)-binding protein [Lophiostoma macrostomum CBS 122681]